MSTSLNFGGVYTALVTPMRGEAIAWSELDTLVDHQIAAGVAGLVAVGTTGESPTLTTEEHLAVIGRVVAAARGRVPVIAGTGANATAEALHLTREADALGADAFLQVAPYYNKPSPEGVYRHFAAIAEATAKPIMLYSIPGRCGIDIAIPTVVRLQQSHANVVAIKEAGGDVQRVRQLRQACGPGMQILCGDDGLLVPFSAAGACGIVSVASNCAPHIIVQLAAACAAGDYAAARAIEDRYQTLLSDVVFIEGNPVSVKTAMHACGLLTTPDVRLPLAPMSDTNRQRLLSVLTAMGLLPS
jgi:4-hydroxy-tetrahydrodipicolinate synthase